MNFKLVFLIGSFCLGALNAQAQKSSTFAAIVQYVEGQVEQLEDQNQLEPMAFKDLILQGEKVQLGQGALLKVVADNGCICVIYGPGSLQYDSDGLWQMEAAGLRWICGSDTSVAFQYKQKKFVITAGEIFVWQEQWAAFSGSARVDQQRIDLKAIYKLSPSGFDKVSEKSWDLFAFHNKARRPKESMILPNTQPLEAKKLSDRRVVLSYGVGKGKIQHDKSGLNGETASLDRAQIQYQKASRIYALGFTSLDESSAACCENKGAVDRLRVLSLETGWRFRTGSWWSPILRLGVEAMSNELELNYQNQGHYSRRVIEYVGLISRAGVEAIYEPKWLGGLALYSSVEAQLSRSLFSTKESVKQRASSSAKIEQEEQADSGLTAFSLGFHLGIAKSF